MFPSAPPTLEGKAAEAEKRRSLLLPADNLRLGGKKQTCIFCGIRSVAIACDTSEQKQFVGGKMALSLGVSVGEGIFVGDSIVVVRAIHGHKLMVVAVNGGPDIRVDDNKADAEEILPGVRVFTGLDKDGTRSRLAFDAPESISIRRVGYSHF